MELILGLLFLFAMICLPFLLLLGVYYACLFGVLGVLSLIFDRPKKPEPSYDPRKYESTLTVVDAIQYDWITSLRDLLKDGANPNQHDEAGETPVMLATRKGRTEALQMLIETGANLDTQNKKGQTAVMLAARKGRVEALQMLIEAGADLDARNTAGQTALFLAVMKEHVESVRILIEAGTDINAMTPKGETSLDVAKKPEIVRLLKAAGGF